MVAKGTIVVMATENVYKTLENPIYMDAIA